MNATDAFAVQRAITVDAAQARAFELFCEMTAWWPLDSHTIGAAPARANIVEPRAGGRWYDIDANGDEHGIGHVLVYDPPHRLVLTWEISCGWVYDEAVASEVDVRFVAETPTRTRVELEHRRFDVYGERAADQRAVYEGDGAWTYVLQCYARVAGSASHTPAGEGP